LVLRGAAADWSFQKGVDKELFEDLPDMHLPFVDDKLSCTLCVIISFHNIFSASRVLVLVSKEVFLART